MGFSNKHNIQYCPGKLCQFNQLASRKEFIYVRITSKVSWSAIVSNLLGVISVVVYSVMCPNCVKLFRVMTKLIFDAWIMFRCLSRGGEHVKLVELRNQLMFFCHCLPRVQMDVHAVIFEVLFLISLPPPLPSSPVCHYHV